jgi:mRNA-degrading endonuclease RelE of RelBE toxin-antitoxin system
MPPHPIDWLEQAKLHIRAIDRRTAMQIFDGVLHHATTGAGDVEPLHGDQAGSFRLRVGDYRVFFKLENNTMRIFGVRHRSQAYR